MSELHSVYFTNDDRILMIEVFFNLILSDHYCLFLTTLAGLINNDTQRFIKRGFLSPLSATNFSNHMCCQSPYVQFTLINVKVNYFNHKLGSDNKNASIFILLDPSA